MIGFDSPQLGFVHDSRFEFVKLTIESYMSENKSNRREAKRKRKEEQKKEFRQRRRKDGKEDKGHVMKKKVRKEGSRFLGFWKKIGKKS